MQWFGDIGNCYGMVSIGDHEAGVLPEKTTRAAVRGTLTRGPKGFAGADSGRHPSPSTGEMFDTITVNGADQRVLSIGICFERFNRGSNHTEVKTQSWTLARATWDLGTCSGLPLGLSFDYSLLSRIATTLQLAPRPAARSLNLSTDGFSKLGKSSGPVPGTQPAVPSRAERNKP
jgi:hypothetical protein